MPRTKRAGKKHQARLLLKKYYESKEFNPSVFNKDSAPKARIISDKTLTLTEKIKLIKRQAYKLHRIEAPVLPPLPPQNIISVPRDPRPKFYRILRKALLYYFYGGRVPEEKPLNRPWPSYTTNIDKIKTCVRQSMQYNDVIIIE